MARSTRRMVADYFALGVLCLGALAFAAFGVQWLMNPDAMAHPLGIVLTNGDATSDARAVYGGMELGLAAFLAYCAAAKERRGNGLMAATLTLSGLGLSRLTGIHLATGGVSPGTWQLLTTDLGGALLCAATFVAHRLIRPDTAPAA